MRNTAIILLFVLATAALHGQNCDIEGVQYFTYQDIKTILDNNGCDNCHSPTGSSPEWTYGSYDRMLQVGECNIPVIVHGNASRSLLYDKIDGGTTDCGAAMPIAQPKMNPSDVYAIESWINAGATSECIPLYQEVVESLGKYNCGTCHTASSSWSMQSYQHMTGLSGSSLCEDVVVSFDAESSVLYNLLSNVDIDCNADIPAHEPISDDDLNLLRDWINGGVQEAASSLPVELINFNINQDSKSKIHLLWSTASEIGTEKFILQRKLGNSDFREIATIEANGNSSQQLDYEYTDEEEIIGLAYYRLLIVDNDGTFSYSNILSERVDPNRDILRSFPNPIMGGEQMTITWFSRLERPETNASIVNAYGQVVKVVILKEGKNEIDLPKVSNGLYYIVVQDYFDSYQLERIIVVN